MVLALPPIVPPQQGSVPSARFVVHPSKRTVELRSTCMLTAGASGRIIFWSCSAAQCHATTWSSQCTGGDVYVPGVVGRVLSRRRSDGSVRVWAHTHRHGRCTRSASR